MRALIADVSGWDNPVDYRALKAAGFEAVIVKSGGSLIEDRLLPIHAAGTLAAGMFLGLFYWVDPLLDEEAQADHIIQQATRYKANFLVADNEQWWADWDKWRRAIQRKIPWSDVPKLSSDHINQTANGFMRCIRMNQTRPVINYTGIGFINDWCRPMLSWINDYSLMLAQYHPTGPKMDLKRVQVTFDQLKASYLPAGEPSIPAKMNKPAMWQWTGDRFTFPGVPCPLDISFWMDEKQTLGEWIGTPPPDPVANPWEDKHLKAWVTAGLRVRKGAGTQYEVLRVLPAGSYIRIVPGHLENGVWAKLYGELGFVHSDYIE
jgi:GH25 family lysozyme M1 (1,4-beta-N-acetylmuramidase)